MIKPIVNAVTFTLIAATILWLIACFSLLQFVPFYYGSSTGASYGRMWIGIIFLISIIVSACVGEDCDGGRNK